MAQILETIDRENKNISDIAKKEGTYSCIDIYNPSIIAPSSGATNFGSYTLVPTECFLAKSANLSINKGAATAGLQFYSGPSNQSQGEIIQRHPLDRNSISLEMDQVFTAGSVVYGLVREGDGTTLLSAGLSVPGYRITADLNFGAKKVVMWIGDSVIRGTNLGGAPYTNFNNFATAVSPMDHFSFQVRNHFQERGLDCRLIIKAMGSYTSRMMGYWIKQGFLDVDQVDCLVYQLGINDANTGTTDAQYNAELTYFINWRDRKHPKSKILFVGPSPLNNNTSETRLAQLRALMAARQDINSNIYYTSLANSFDRTILTNYSASDGVHPNIPTNILMTNAINSFIDTNDFTF